MKYPLTLLIMLGVLFFLKSNGQSSGTNDSTSSLPAGIVYNIPEVEASFPGGMLIGNKYFYRSIELHRKVLNEGGAQFCYLKFIVDIEGNISEIKSNKAVETKLDEIVIKALKTGPKWIPARHKGAKVSSYVSLTFIFEPNKTGKTAYAKNSVNFFVTRENLVEKQYKNVLVLVSGTTAVRIFTDQFYESLEKYLKNNGIETEYVFLGNDGQLAKDNLANVSRVKKFEAILLIIPDENSKITEKYIGPGSVNVYPGVKYFSIFPGVSSYGSEISIRSLSIKQSMNIYLIEPENLDTPIMETKVFMNFQLMKKSAYLKAARDFLKILKDNKIGVTGI